MRVILGLLTAGCFLAGGIAHGQPFPSKPVRIVTGTVGSNSDFLARLIGQGISGPLGQPVVVDNRGSGFLAAEAPWRGKTELSLS